MIMCQYCGHEGWPEKGIAPRPSKRPAWMCASCRGEITDYEPEEEEVINDSLYDCVD